MSEVISILSARSASIANAAATSASTPAGAKSFSAALAEASKRPTGEKTQDVKGHTSYDKIVAGPDKGEYLNRSGNAREGEAFRIVQRGGRTFHVYSTGDEHNVVRLPLPGGTSGGTPAA